MLKRVKFSQSLNQRKMLCKIRVCFWCFSIDCIICWVLCIQNVTVNCIFEHRTIKLYFSLVWILVKYFHLTILNPPCQKYTTFIIFKVHFFYEKNRFNPAWVTLRNYTNKRKQYAKFKNPIMWLSIWKAWTKGMASGTHLLSERRSVSVRIKGTRRFNLIELM
jgi:hypothetical protein